MKVGRSKFMELRPKNVVLAGTAGTHNVCVCVLHQNVKLTFEGCKLSTSTRFKEMLGLPDDVLITYKHLLAKLSCNPPQPECYLGECSVCSNTNVEGGCNFCNEDGNAAEWVFCSKLPQLKASLMEIFNDMGVDEISYKAWVSVDHSTLETLTKGTEDFVDTLLQNLSSLRTHDFIAKQQAAFLFEKKANLKEGEAVVNGDFAQNYSFVILDSVQGFHWNNDQATIHPVVAYYKQPVSQGSTRTEATDTLQSLNFAIISNCVWYMMQYLYTFL